MSEGIRILFAEDEPSLGMIVKESLESRGFVVHLCENGRDALELFSSTQLDIVVLDVMMPLMDGFSVAQRIRKNDQLIPIIFLTAKSRTEDVIEGFGYGANDYIKKPFSMEELIVRINALLQRVRNQTENEWITLGKLSFNPDRQVLRVSDREEQLTSKESQLLHHLYRNKNALTGRSEILNSIWGNDDFFTARSMDVYISKLRKKLKADPSIEILNIRGAGYKLVV